LTTSSSGTLALGYHFLGIITLTVDNGQYLRKQEDNRARYSHYTKKERDPMRAERRDEPPKQAHVDKPAGLEGDFLGEVIISVSA